MRAKLALRTVHFLFFDIPSIPLKLTLGHAQFHPTAVHDVSQTLKSAGEGEPSFTPPYRRPSG